TYIIDVFAVNPSPLWDVLAEVELVIHHAAFDLAFLGALGFTPGRRVTCTMLMAQLLVAGTYDKVSLKDCCQRSLNRTIDKGEQRSDWTGALTNEQLAYAAADADALLPLYTALRAELEAAKLEGVADLELRCLPAVVWMGGKGVAVDRAAWTALAELAGG